MKGLSLACHFQAILKIIGKAMSITPFGVRQSDCKKVQPSSKISFGKVHLIFSGLHSLIPVSEFF
jgi:hypothetical protein